jgi:glycosyltransferase involved in cell wall biosynthesis
MKLSIIIPMYNAGRFIEKCLRSCMAQDIPSDDYEVVVIDDGSTDDGASLVEELRDRNGWNNLTVIRRPNGGVSVARNIGIEEASGDYLWYVDSDDWIEEKCLATLLEKAEGNDILEFGAVDIHPTEDGMVPGEVFSYPQDVVRSGPEHLHIMSEKLKMCVPFSIYRKDFLMDKGLRFVPGLLHEDTEFIPRATCEAERVGVCRLTPYRRFVRTGSQSRNGDIRRIDALLEVASRLHDYRDSGKVGSGQVASMNSIISNILNQAIKLVRLFRDSGDGIESGFVSKFAGLKWSREVFLNARELKYKVEGLLISLFPRRPVEVYSFLVSFKRK